ncbi:MAG: hypothetical protein GY719_28185 [bacterium]|nr:hypothetical protein [bacterium]
MSRSFEWSLATLAALVLAFGSTAGAESRQEFPEPPLRPIAKVPGYDLELPYTMIEGEPVFVMDDVLLDEETLEVFFSDLREPDHVAARHATNWKTWPDGIVPYVISTGALTVSVKEAIEYIEDNSNVRFVPRSDEAGYVDFIDTGNNQCNTYIGYKASRRIADLAQSKCTHQAVVRHEILHALGFYHTHQRHDRDDHVIYFPDCVRSGESRNFSKMTYGRTIPDIPYDLQSIMHYNSYLMCKRVCASSGDECVRDSDCPGTDEKCNAGCLCCPLEVAGEGCPSNMGGGMNFTPDDLAALDALYPEPPPQWGACTDSGTKKCVHVLEHDCSGPNAKWFAGQECGEVGACCWSNFGCECDILDEDACRGRPYCHGGLCRPGGKFWPGEWCGAPPCESASCYSQWDLLGTRGD